VRYGLRSVQGRRAAAQAAALAVTLGTSAAAHSGVIPLPAEIVPGAGSFEIDAASSVQVPRGDRDATQAARYLVDLWSRTNGLSLQVTNAAGRKGAAAAGVIVFRRQSGLAPEAYVLDVAPRRITVSAGSAAGLFYGAVTLWQLLPPGPNAGPIPAQTIRDAPAYAWRGVMLDSARHIQSPAAIRSMIDWMAWHKLNVLHWHLTDDQGWRLQIRRYPRLTSVGAWRIDPSGARYGGFYTQNEVRDIVRFAAARHVQIVPEIDMPGHATAAVAAYPELGEPDPPSGTSGSGTPAGPLAVSASWGILAHVFNTEPQTFAFLENVLAEVIRIFPSPVIHIGGDETGGQALFATRMGGYLAAHGRRIVGWDEILQPGLRKDAIVMSWHGVSGAHTAALAGNDTVLAPDPALYFDHRQSTLPTEPPGRLNVISLEDVYRFEPNDAALSAGQRHHVLGIQANLWTEHIRNDERLQWMALPRAAALAEVAWSAQRRHWPDFLARLVPMFTRYRAFGLDYSDSVFAPAAQFSRSAGGYDLALSNQAQSGTAASAAGIGEIRYTLDGRDPTAQSSRYETPLKVSSGTEIRAAAFVGADQASRTWTRRVDAKTMSRRDSHSLEQCGDGVGLLLEPASLGSPASGGLPLAIDIMNPCWIDRGVDLSEGPSIVAAVAPLPFNYELGADAAKIRVGDARSAEGELEIHIDGCDTPVRGLLPLAPAAGSKGVTTLPAQELPRLPGKHDLCLRFARPRLDPMWALDWIEIGE
jgi:hexosaminidase